MKKSVEISKIAKELTEDQFFLAEIKSYVKKIQSQSTQVSQNSIEFAFERGKSYPWSVYDGRETVEGMEIIKGINETLFELFDSSLHAVLNKEFINVTNEILAMREEISNFTSEQLKKQEQLRGQLTKQLSEVKKKMIIQQSTANFSKQPSSRLRSIANMNAANHQMAPEGFEKKSYHSQLYELKKQVEALKQQDHSVVMKGIAEKLVFVQEKLSNQLVSLKIKVEGVKQKSQKNSEHLSSKIEASSNKQLVNQEIKRTLKSSMKVYMDQLALIKKSSQLFDDKIAKLDKNLQEYIMTQCKSIWFQCNNMKRRIENIQESSNLNNQSFIME